MKISTKQQNNPQDPWYQSLNTHAQNPTHLIPTLSKTHSLNIRLHKFPLTP